MVLAISSRELADLGFQNLTDANHNPCGVAWLDKPTGLVIARQTERGEYAVGRVRDATGKFYGAPQEPGIEERFGNVPVPELISKLRQTRWLNVPPEEIPTLTSIALCRVLSKREEIYDRARELFRDKKYERTRDLLELELDQAMMAADLGKGRQYVEGKLGN